ncbi:heme o synthase, partial [Rhizobiaceae bacterium]|nr:heme o synthase [Rhizobiaceae bacterium]
MTATPAAVSVTAAPQDVSLAMPADYFSLMKPRVMRLVIFTALAGMLLAPGPLDPFIAVVAIVAIAVGAGASGALNMWYDADIDAVMTRTANRAVPSGRVTANEALVYGMVMAAFSVGTLGLLVNWTAGFWLAFTIFFYAVIYTMGLKRRTPQNIVIGGAAGAFPPMIGWAVTTGHVGVEAWVLFAIILIWTPPHFWALALWKMADYDDAHVPMMPNARGVASTRRQMLAYSALLLPVS